MQTSDWLDDFITIYQHLNKDNLTTLRAIYHSEVVFIDPLHKVEGIEALVDYFTNLYQNLNSCQFEINEQVIQEQTACLYWEMRFQHPKLNSGREIRVEGHSLLKRQDGKIIYHRDYLDAGAMLYEHLPLVGGLIKLIKAKAAK